MAMAAFTLSRTLATLFGVGAARRKVQEETRGKETAGRNLLQQIQYQHNSTTKGMKQWTEDCVREQSEF